MGADKFFEQTKNFNLIWIVAFLSPQMFDEVIFEIIMGSHIFNLGGSLAIVLKK
jgi:hypothetical protein